MLAMTRECRATSVCQPRGGVVAEGGDVGEPVQRPLGLQLLPDADQRVGHQHDAEQRVLRLAPDQDHGQQDTQDQVEPGQDVRPQDLGDRAAGPLPARVRQAA
jgi:hypothetical protein